MKKLSLFLAVLLLTLTILAGCSSSSKTATDNTASELSFTEEDRGFRGGDVSQPASAPEASDEKSAPQVEKEESPDADTNDTAYGSLSDASTAANQKEVFGGEMGAKIIKNGYMSVETLDFDDTTSTIIRKVQQEGGFIASSNIQGWSRKDTGNKPMRNAHFKVRIPSDRFEQYMTDIGELGNVTRTESWGEDVSAQYFDTEARLESLTTQEDRLLTILSKAEKLSDILELERELSDVRYEIENLTGTLKKWDNLVAYSTLDLDVYEVEKIEEIEKEPENLWEKIAGSFHKSLKNIAIILENLLIFLIGAIPFLVLFAVIGLIAYAIVRSVRKRNGSNGQEMQTGKSVSTTQTEQKDKNGQNEQKEE